MKRLVFVVATLSVAGCTIISGLDETFRSPDAAADGGSPDATAAVTDATAAGTDADGPLTDAARAQDATIPPDGDASDEDGGSVPPSDGGVRDGSPSTDVFALDPTFGVDGIATFPVDPAGLPSLGVLPSGIVLFGSVVADATSGSTAPELISADLDGGWMKTTFLDDAGTAFGGEAAGDAFYAGVSFNESDGEESNAVLHLYTYPNDAAPAVTPSSSIAEESPMHLVRLGAGTLSAVGYDSQGDNVVTFSLTGGAAQIYETAGIEGYWYGGAALATGGFALVGGCNPYFQGCDGTNPGGIRQFAADGSAIGNETVLTTALAADVQTTSSGQTLAVAANPRVDSNANPTGDATMLTFLVPFSASAPVNVTVTDNAGLGIAIPPFGNVRLVPNPNAAVGGFIAGWTLLGDNFSGDSAVHLTFVQANGKPAAPGTLDFPVGAGGAYFGALAVDTEGRVYAAIQAKNSWQVLRFRYAPAH